MERMHEKRKDNIYNTMPVVDGLLLPDSVDRLIRHPLPVDTLIGFTNNDMYAPVMAFIGKRYAKANGAYVYYFDLDSPGDDNRAFHSCDLRYIFETLEGSWRPYRKRDREVSGELAQYLANFARTGDPNGEGLPHWQKAEKGRGKVLHITPLRTAMGHVHYGKLIVNMLQKGDPKDEV